MAALNSWITRVFKVVETKVNVFEKLLFLDSMELAVIRIVFVLFIATFETVLLFLDQCVCKFILFFYLQLLQDVLEITTRSGVRLKHIRSRLIKHVVQGRRSPQSRLFTFICRFRHVWCQRFLMLQVSLSGPFRKLRFFLFLLFLLTQFFDFLLPLFLFHQQSILIQSVAQMLAHFHIGLVSKFKVLSVFVKIAVERCLAGITVH